MSRLNDRIKEARIKAGLSQKELGERAGISAAVIGHYETGYRRPKFETISKIADALGCETDDLLANPKLGFATGSVDPDVERAIADGFIYPSAEVWEKLRAIGWSVSLDELGTSNDWIVSSGDGSSFSATTDELTSWNCEIDSFAEFKLHELMKKKFGDI